MKKYLNNKMVPIILALLPLIYLSYQVFNNFIIIPIRDDWELVNLLNKYYLNTLSVWDFTAFHNEHRLFFPKIVMFLIAIPSKWNLVYTVTCSLITGIGIFLIIISLAKRVCTGINPTYLYRLLIPISLLVFSLTQWENWMFGWQIQIFMSILGILTAVYFSSMNTFQWSKFFIAVGGCILASFSYANGLSSWFIAFFLLYFVTYKNFNHKKVVLGLFAVIAALSIGLFFSGGMPVNYSGDDIEVRSSKGPLHIVMYILLYLGHSVVYPHNSSVILGLFTGIFGLVGIVIFFISLYYLLYHKDISLKYLSPIIALGLYSIGSATITAIGRISYGLNSALWSRYSTISMYLWVANFILLLMIYSDIQKPAPVKRFNIAAWLSKNRIGSSFNEFLKKYFVTFSLASMVILTLLISINSFASSKRFIYYHRYYTSVIPEFVTMDNDTLLKRIYPNLNRLKYYIRLSNKNKVSVFRDINKSINVTKNTASPVYAFNVENIPTDTTFKLQTEEFIEADSLIIYQGRLFHNQVEISCGNISLILCSDHKDYKVPGADAIRKLDRDGGIFTLIWKNKLNQGVYSIKILCELGNRKYIVDTNKKVKVL